VTKLDCIGCHSSIVNITVGPLAGGTRRAVANELKTSGTRNHKGTAIGADATKWDCIVCHMEGDYATGSSDPAYHKNGVIDFRNPDTGAVIKKVRWNGGAANTADAAGRYADTLTNFTTSRLTRDLSQTLESDPQWLRVASIQMNLCLKCHDYNGAANSTAWTKNAAGTVVGNALRPFGLAVGSTATLYNIGPAGNTANKTAAGNTTSAVMNVFTQVSSGNASYHPIRGRQNNSYATGSRMKAPWGNTTKAVQRVTTIYGFLISCFDCHATLGASGLQTGSVVAHGNGTTAAVVQMRGPTFNTTATAGAPNLCTMCHGDAYATTSNNHGGGAYTSGGSSMNASTMGTCSQCHGSGTLTAGSRATDAHGFEGMLASGANLGGAGSRTYNFFRQATNLNGWSPGTCVNSSGCTANGTYTPGGVY
jgi:hypothetical protein